MATWTGGNNDWNTPIDWSSYPSVPGVNLYGTAIINNNATVTVGAADQITNGFPNLVVGKTTANGGTGGSLIVNGNITGMNGAEIGANGTVTVNAGGNFGDTQALTIDQSGTFSLNGTAATSAIASINGGITVNGTLMVGKYSTLTDGSGLTVAATGVVNIYGTFVPGSSGLNGGGTVNVNGGTFGSASTALNLNGTNNLVISNGATVYVNNANPPGSITFGGGSGNTLVLTNYIGTLSTPISGFAPGDTIQFNNSSNAGTGGATLTSNGNGTYSVHVTGSNVVLSNVTLAPGVTPSQVSAQPGSGGYDVGGCFLPGSLIATPTGDTAVEALVAGDKVVTLEAGEMVAKSVKWVGYRHVKAGDVSGDDAHPVRIKAGAFAEYTPARDLLVTNEHCVVVAGQLTPVRLLVNGRSIIVDTSISDFTYYHVELDEHGILLAEGLAVESYLDSGNRSNFANAEVAALRPRFSMAVRAVNQAQPVLPLLVEPAGLQPVWEALNARAIALGLPKISPEPALTHDADIRIVTAAGTVLHPAHQQDNKVVFMLPANTAGVLLASRTSRPCDVTAPYIDDRRELGLSIGEITVRIGTATISTTAHLTMAELAGWHAVEAPGYRWTNGLAALPIDELTKGQAATLEIQLLRFGPYLACTAAPDAIAA